MLNQANNDGVRKYNLQNFQLIIQFNWNINMSIPVTFSWKIILYN